MSKQGPANLAHSVHVRLLALAKREGIDFNLLLSRYVIERFLYRLSGSKHRDRFVLKGAMLFAAWMRRPHRSTRDLDLLGLGDLSEAVVPDVFRETFERRKAQLGPPLPAGLTDEFSRDPTKQTQWAAFLRKHDLSDANLELNVVTGAVRDFLEPPLRSVAGGQGFAKHWPAGGPWI